MGEFNYEAKILSNDVWTHAVAVSECLASKKAEFSEFESKQLHYLCCGIYKPNGEEINKT